MNLKTILMVLLITSLSSIGFLACEAALMEDGDEEGVKDVHERNIAYFYDFDYEKLQGTVHLIGPDFEDMEEGYTPPKTSDYYDIQYVKVLRNNEGRVLSVQAYKAGNPHGFWTYFDRHGNVYSLKYFYDGELKQVIDY